MQLAMQQLEILPLRAAFSILLRSNVVTEDQLLDFSNSEALRSIEAAAFSSDCASDSGAADTDDNDAFSMLIEQAIRLQGQQVAIFVMWKLLHRAAVSPGNHPSRKWVNDTVARSASILTLGFSSAKGTARGRKVQLGVLRLMQGVWAQAVRAVTSAGRTSLVNEQHVNVCKALPDYTAATLKELLPAASGLAEWRDAALRTRDVSSVANDLTRLQIEANDFPIGVAGCLGRLLLHALSDSDDQIAANTSAGRMIFDMSLLSELWSQLTVVRNCLGRLPSWYATRSSVIASGVPMVIRLIDEMAKQRRRVEFAEYNKAPSSAEMKLGLDSRLCWMVSAIGFQGLVEGGLQRINVPKECGGRLRDPLSAFIDRHNNDSANRSGDDHPAIFNMKVALSSCVLLCGSIGDEELTLQWEQSRDVAQSIHAMLAQHVLKCSDELVSSLAALLCRSIWGHAAHRGSSSTQVDCSIDTCIEMLSVQDAAANYAVEIVAEALAQRPHLFVPRVLQLLRDEESSPKRKNAIEVLARLPTDPKMPKEALEILSDEIISRIDDVALQQRVQSAGILSKLPPDIVAPKLFSLCRRRDPSGKRSHALKTALVTILEGCDGALLPILDALVACEADLEQSGGAVLPQTVAPSTPADIIVNAADCEEAAADTTNSSNDESPIRGVKMMRAVVMKVLEGSPNGKLPQLLDLMKKVLETKSSTVFIDALRCCSKHFIFSDDAKAAVAEIVAPRIILCDDSFAVVAPFLVLRVLPPAFFSSPLNQSLSPLLPKISNLVFNSTQTVDQPTRKLFADVFCMFPQDAVLAITRQQLAQLVSRSLGPAEVNQSVLESSFISWRTTMYVYCITIAAQTSSCCSEAQVWIPLAKELCNASMMLLRRCRPVVGRSSPSESLMKLLRGCIDTVATTCVAEMICTPASSSPPDKKEENNSSWPASHIISTALQRLGATENAKKSELPDMDELDLAEVLLSVLFHSKSHTSKSILLKKFSVLLPLICRAANFLCSSRKFPSATKFATVVFNFCACGGNFIDAGDADALWDFGLGCARFTQHSDLEFEGLKIIASLMASAGDDRGSGSAAGIGISARSVEAGISVLRSASDMHQRPDIRQFAQKMINIIANGV